MNEDSKDSFYIAFTKDVAVASSKSSDGNLRLDYDADGQLIGVEVLGLIKRRFLVALVRLLSANGLEGSEVFDKLCYMLEDEISELIDTLEVEDA